MTLATVRPALTLGAQMSRSALAALGTALLVLVTACSATDPEPAPTSGPAFPPGTTMQALHDAGKVRIGIKTDQPGLGYRPPGQQQPTGFDIDIAVLLAQALGLGQDQIEWVTSPSFERESQLRAGEVDLIVASYSISDARREAIGQAGPYFVTGQQILVRTDDSSIARPEDLDGKSVCSVTGSASGEYVHQEYGAIPSAYNSYQPCITALLDGKLDAVSTDGVILLGFWKEHEEELKIVGAPFTTERYGIGYLHGDTGMCEFLNATLLEIYKSGAWADAYDKNLGIEGVEAPPPPRPDPCDGSTPSSTAAPTS